MMPIVGAGLSANSSLVTSVVILSRDKPSIMLAYLVAAFKPASSISPFAYRAWNLKNRSYLNLPEARTLHLNTESTFSDAAATIEQIATRFNIEKLEREFVDFTRSTKKSSGRDGDYYRDYYLNEKWRGELSTRAIKLINQDIDHELVEYYGYTLL